MKKLYAIVLSLVMTFAFASTAMAADTATLNVNGDEYTVNVQAGDSVYTLLDRWATEEAKVYIDWKDVASDIGDGTGKVLVQLGEDASKPYTPEDLEEYDLYDPSAGDTVLDNANEVLKTEFPASGGLYMWLGKGVGVNLTFGYGVYVGDDWMFTINDETPVDAADPSIELYMNQATVKAGDVIELTYGTVYKAFEM